jgi:hypothetical protein
MNRDENETFRKLQSASPQTMHNRGNEIRVPPLEKRSVTVATGKSLAGRYYTLVDLKSWGVNSGNSIHGIPVEFNRLGRLRIAPFLRFLIRQAVASPGKTCSTWTK